MLCVLTRCVFFLSSSFLPLTFYSPFLAMLCQALITNKEVEAMQGGGRAGCCGWRLVAVDKMSGEGDRNGVRGFRVNGLIDWSSPVHLFCFINKPGGVNGAL